MWTVSIVAEDRRPMLLGQGCLGETVIVLWGTRQVF